MNVEREEVKKPPKPEHNLLINKVTHFNSARIDYKPVELDEMKIENQMLQSYNQNLRANAVL